MGLVRIILGWIILFLNRLTWPKAPDRSPEDQALLDSKTENLVLYEFEACPFCVKVRRHIQRLGLKIPRRDAAKNEVYKKELIQGGGDYQTPCLRIETTSGVFEWLYESDAIKAYLDRLNAAR